MLRKPRFADLHGLFAVSSPPVLFGKLRTIDAGSLSIRWRRRSSIRGLSATPTLWDDCELIRLTCRPKLSVIVSVTL